MGFRSPTVDESRLLRELARIARIEDPDSWVEELRVREMDDGGMGSLELETEGSHGFGRAGLLCRAAVQFADADGVEVIASLYSRADGEPFELDVWKTDFSKLLRIPHHFRRVEE